jgi:enoyl-CoA hydratase/carnithine racemase
MGEILVERHGSVATIVLSNPARRNAISVSMWQALQFAFEGASADLSLRCVVLRGAAGHFAAGADIEEFPTVRADLARLRHYHEGIIAPALAAIGTCVHPTVALIEGVCVGGGLEIAAHCDLRLCCASARLGVPINRLGFPMAPDELLGLLAIAGRAVTLELLLEGRIWEAREALEKGLVNRVVEQEAFEAEAVSLIERIASMAPLAARLNKALIQRFATSRTPLSEAERQWAFSYADSRDHREGVAAFLENRAPRFTGT